MSRPAHWCRGWVNKYKRRTLTYKRETAVLTWYNGNILALMIGSIESLLHIDETSFVETWIRYFTALMPEQKAQGQQSKPTVFNKTTGRFKIKKINCVLNRIRISKVVRLATVVEGDQKAPFSIATTPRCRGGCYSFPWMAPLYPWYVPYIAEC